MDTANKIYDILVQDAGANENGRENFCYWFNSNGGCEYRFCGNLGFGGKFWRNGVYHINCYREDLTPEKEAIIAKVNQKLKEQT